MEFPITFRSVMAHIGMGGLLLGILTNIKIDPYICYSLSALLSVSLIIIDGMNSLWESRITTGTDPDGRKSYNLITEAKESIIVTHFGSDTPTDTYISLLIEKCRQGVPLTRFINNDLDLDNEKYLWMKSFDNVPNYHLVRVPYRMPLDIMIFDGKTIKVSFPNSASVSSRFPERCIIRNKEVARMFQKSLDAGTIIRKEPPSGGSPR